MIDYYTKLKAKIVFVIKALLYDFEKETPCLETLLENKDNFVTFSLSEFVAERKRVQGLCYYMKSIA